MIEKVKAFVARNKVYILIAIAVYILLTILLIVLSGGGESLPFVYQVY
jgi:hypothetical protein